MKEGRAESTARPWLWIEVAEDYFLAFFAAGFLAATGRAAFLAAGLSWLRRRERASSRPSSFPAMADALAGAGFLEAGFAAAFLAEAAFAAALSAIAACAAAKRAMGTRKGGN